MDFEIVDNRVSLPPLGGKTDVESGRKVGCVEVEAKK